MLLWPVVAVAGFVVLAAVVIALATSSTAQYEFERNQVQGQRPQAAAPVATGAVPVPSAVAEQSVRAGAVGAPLAQRSAVGLATHPAGKRVPDLDARPAWWLLDGTGTRLSAGPFADRIEADWAALSGAYVSAGVVYAVRGADGGPVRRQSPEERAWLADLGSQLDRLPEEWDESLSDDDDELVSLVVEVAAALVEAGLPVHDCAGDGPAGGVCLTPEPARRGVLVSWHQHERMSRHQVRGTEAGDRVQQTMTAAVTECLHQLGFPVQPYGATGCALVQAEQRS
jgi:hypothetical protein